MLYRPYTPQDFAALYAIEELCFQPPFRFETRLMRQLVCRSDAATWIAEEDGRLAGFAITEWTRRQEEIRAYIQTIEVAPELRGQGVGRELLVRSEGSARSAGAALIWLHVDPENSAAIHLYVGHGYRCDGREENYYPLGSAALIYLKRLNPR